MKKIKKKLKSKSNFDEEKVQKFCDGISDLRKNLNLSLLEMMYGLSHSTLELGLTFYKLEGGKEIDLSKLISDQLEMIEQSYVKAPTLGKAIIIQSLALHRIREMFIENQEKTNDN